MSSALIFKAGSTSLELHVHACTFMHVWRTNRIIRHIPNWQFRSDRVFEVHVITIYLGIERYKQYSILLEIFKYIYIRSFSLLEKCVKSQRSSKLALYQSTFKLWREWWWRHWFYYQILIFLHGYINFDYNNMKTRLIYNRRLINVQKNNTVTTDIILTVQTEEQKKKKVCILKNIVP